MWVNHEDNSLVSLENGPFKASSNIFEVELCTTLYFRVNLPLPTLNSIYCINKVKVVLLHRQDWHHLNLLFLLLHSFVYR